VKKLALAAIIMLLIADALWLYAPTRPLVLILLGRTSVCSLTQSLHAYENTQSRVLPIVREIRQDGAYHQWDTPMGAFWVPARTDMSIAEVVGEEMTDAYGRDFVRQGDVVLDCGANVGAFTRKALSRGAGLVVSIEPVPENVECLRRNFAREIADGRVIVYAKGVWDKDASLEIHRGKTSAWDSFVVDGVSGERLPVATIDSIVRELALGRVDAIKIDVEGAEKRALVGARSAIQRWRPRLSFDPEPVAPREIQELVRAISPAYNMICGTCVDVRTYIAPVSVSFY
jgi:FkbM family methyltransferase